MFRLYGEGIILKFCPKLETLTYMVPLSWQSLVQWVELSVNMYKICFKIGTIKVLKKILFPFLGKCGMVLNINMLFFCVIEKLGYGNVREKRVKSESDKYIYILFSFESCNFTFYYIDFHYHNNMALSRRCKTSSFWTCSTTQQNR